MNKFIGVMAFGIVVLFTACSGSEKAPAATSSAVVSPKVRIFNSDPLGSPSTTDYNHRAIVVNGSKVVVSFITADSLYKVAPIVVRPGMFVTVRSREYADAFLTPSAITYVRGRFRLGVLADETIVNVVFHESNRTIVNCKVSGLAGDYAAGWIVSCLTGQV